MTQRETSGSAPDLSVIVPVYNAAGHLPNLVQDTEALDALGVRAELIFVDDGSADDSLAIARALSDRHAHVTALAFPENRGAGLARNLGWRHASGRYAIFFDADDIMHTPVVAEAVRALDAAPTVDVAMHAYRYEREETAAYTAMGLVDQTIFSDILKGASTAICSTEDAHPLLTFTNYPWNKIIRSARFRETGIRYGSTRVNNDILGHWYSLLFARNVMVREAVICTHIVHPAGSNITNNFGAARLQIFDALNELYDLLETNPVLRAQVAHHYWDFAIRLLKWARSRLDPFYAPRFDALQADLLARVDLRDFARMRSFLAPALADHFVRQFA